MDSHPGCTAAARRVCTCATGAQHCCASCVHVCHGGATLLRVACVRVPRGRNTAARRVCTCATGAQHCCASCVYVCHGGATLLRVVCVRVPPGRNTVARRVCTCATGAQHCCASCVHVCHRGRQRRDTMGGTCVPRGATPFVGSPNEAVKKSGVADAGGACVARSR